MYSYKTSHLWYTLYMPYFVVFAHQITTKMQRSHTHVAFVRQECHDLACKPPPQFLTNAIMQMGGGGGGWGWRNRGILQCMYVLKEL